MKKAYYFACFLGSCAYTIPFFLLSLYLIQFYNPPAHETIPQFLPKEAWFGISILSLLIVVSRVFDVFFDPWIAGRSDSLQSRWGRRMPFLFVFALPATVATLFLFMPPQKEMSWWNALWVLAFFLLAVSSFSAYVTPFLAHISTLGNSEKERLNVSLLQGLGESFGVILAGQAPLLWGMFQESGMDLLAARQYAFLCLLCFACICLYIPIFILYPSDTSQAVAPQPMRKSLHLLLQNKAYMMFLLAYFLFIIGVEMVQAGGYYYITVLLQMPAEQLSYYLALMVPASITAAPLASKYAGKWGKKQVVTLIFFVFAFVLLAASNLGNYSVSPQIQAIVLFTSGGFILGGISALVLAIIGDAVVHSRSTSTEEIPEALFIAAKNFCYKMGITLGAALLASLLLLGKDRGDDFGIRASCLVGGFLSLLAFIIFTKYYPKER
ncbi:MAG: MFS transporter [Spirochaetota bacterium]